MPRVYDDQSADEQRQAILHLDAAIADRRAAIARAERVLRDANLADFRRALRDLFDAHPGLESVRLDQYTQYIDDWVVLAIEHAGVNGRLVRLWFNPVHRAGEAAASIPGFSTDAADRRVGAAWAARQAGGGSLPSGDERRQLRESFLRDELGDDYDYAVAFVGILADFADTYGGHFFWDLFGSRASVRADRDALHISEDLHDPEQPMEPGGSRLRWIQNRLGLLTESYLTSPERTGAAGLRASYTDEIHSITGNVVQARLAVAAYEIRKTGALRFQSRYTLGIHFQWGGVQAVEAGGKTLEVRQTRGYGGEPTRLVFESDRRPLDQDAAERWLSVLNEILVLYGDDAMLPLASELQSAGPHTVDF